MRGFGWGGEEEEEEEGRRRREGADEKGEGEGEGDETVFFVCGDEKREKGKVNKGACWKGSKVRSRRVCRPRDMFLKSCGSGSGNFEDGEWGEDGDGGEGDDFFFLGRGRGRGR